MRTGKNKVRGQFLRVKDPAVAKQLAEAGFKYVSEGEDKFVFVVTDSLLEYMKKHFSSVTFAADNRLHF